MKMTNYEFSDSELRDAIPGWDQLNRAGRRRAFREYAATLVPQIVRVDDGPVLDNGHAPDCPLAWPRGRRDDVSPFGATSRVLRTLCLRCRMTNQDQQQRERRSGSLVRSWPSSRGQRHDHSEAGASRTR
jgi:hypothetical protein